MTNGERLRAARRRKEMTQAEAAKRLQVSLRAYKAAEADEENAPKIRAPVIGALRTHEACRVLRVRKGLTLDDLSAKLGVTKWWLCLMEQGKAPVATLRDFWTR